MSESEGEKLKTALHARAERLLQPVMGASMPLRFVAQNKIAVAHPTLHSGDRCPECHLTREPGDKRTGTFASGIVSLGAWTIALFFTGCKHAGENIAAVMKRRAHELRAPIRMCDALSRNTPKGVETLIANCVAHGRRQMVEVVDHFPEQCRYVLETLCGVSHHDALSRERELSPLMKGLHEWMEAQLGQSDLLFTESLAETDAFSAAKRAHQSTTTTSSVP